MRLPGMSRGAVIATVVAVLALCLGDEAGAARYHVRTTGKRSSGPSQPSSWGSGNCYPTLALAALNAAPADTILLYKQDHTLDAAVVLPSLLANQDLDSLSAECRLLFTPTAGLTFAPAVERASVRGMTCVGPDAATSLPAVMVGGAAATPSVLELRDCLFTEFHLDGPPLEGSCLSAAASAGGLRLSLSRCQFEGNATKGRGGAVFLSDGVVATFEGCRFHGNASVNGASLYGGGAVAASCPSLPAQLQFSSCTLDSNLSCGPGGGLWAEDASLSLVDCDVTRNRGDEGGLTGWSAGAGLFLRRTNTHQLPLSLTITDSRIVGNTGQLTTVLGGGDGGGVLVAGYGTTRMVSVQVTRCLFAANFNDQGAGLYFGRFATGTVVNTRFLGNLAYRNGGGSYKGGSAPENIGETATYVRCEFSGNRAGFDPSGGSYPYGGCGGGFATRLYPRADFFNCTFVDNLCGTTPGSRGDAFYHFSEGQFITDPRQACSLVNCLFYGISGNGQQVASDPNGLKPVTACAYAPQQMNAFGCTPTLTRLLTSSPFVSDTDHHLAQGSVCVDRGVTLGPTVDIEGSPVPQGTATDIGAYESPWTRITTGVENPEWPGATAGLSAFPNPFNPRTAITFDLDRPSRVRLSVCDLDGRRLATLLDASVASGRHVVTWSGRDGRGRGLGSGSYLAVLEDGRSTRTVRLTLLR